MTYQRQSQAHPQQNVPWYSSTGRTCRLSSLLRVALELVELVGLVGPYRVHIADQARMEADHCGDGRRSAGDSRAKTSSGWQVLVGRGGRVSRHSLKGRDRCGR